MSLEKSLANKEMLHSRTQHEAYIQERVQKQIYGYIIRNMY